MHYRTGGRLLPVLIAVGATCALLSACGGSSGDATTLLKQTFGGPHKVNSGQLNIVLRVDPSGSSTLKAPITLSFGGPFQSLGKGKLPQSNFDVSLSSGANAGSIAILSTGTHGYVTFQGQSYQLPAASFQKLESSFSQIASSSGSSGTGSGVLSKLGIRPLHWLQNPKIIGTESVGGSRTTHIRATVNVAVLLADFNTFLSRASSVGISGAASFPHGISAASRERVASEVRNPRFDVWTGTGDKTIRKLQIALTLPVTGQVSTLLGGLSSADIGLSMQYSDLNQQQTITAPTSVQPYSQFQTKLRTFEQGIQNTLAGQATGATGGGSTTGSSSSATTPGTTTPGTTTPGTTTPGTTTPSASGTAPAGSSSKTQAYSQCIQSAGGDVGKMQQCAPLLNGGG
jgi:hypothetical protein